MKRDYLIIIVGSGPHHQGHHTGNLEKDADQIARQTVERLTKAGHTVHAAAFEVDGAPEMIVGTEESLGTTPALGMATDDLDAVALDEVLQISKSNEQRLETILKELRSFARYEKRDDKARSPKGAKKEESQIGEASPPTTLPPIGLQDTTGDAASLAQGTKKEGGGPEAPSSEEQRESDG